MRKKHTEQTDVNIISFLHSRTPGAFRRTLAEKNSKNPTLRFLEEEDCRAQRVTSEDAQ